MIGRPKGMREKEVASVDKAVLAWAKLAVLEGIKDELWISVGIRDDKRAHR